MVHSFAVAEWGQESVLVLFLPMTEDQTEEGKVWEESETDGSFCRLYL